MFIGHYAPALVAAAHPRAPRLGQLFVAAQFVRRQGLARWDRPPVENPLELGLVAVALVFDASRTVARGRAAHLAVPALALALRVAELLDWRTPRRGATIDPPPASPTLAALAAFGVLAALAAWAARNRSARP